MNGAHHVLTRPDAGQVIRFPVGSDDRLEFSVDQSAVILCRDGQHLVLMFEDGGRLNLEGFFDNFGNNARPPVFIMDGCEVTGEGFPALRDAPDIPSPPAGPEPACIARDIVCNAAPGDPSGLRLVVELLSVDAACGTDAGTADSGAFPDPSDLTLVFRDAGGREVSDPADWPFSSWRYDPATGQISFSGPQHDDISYCDIAYGGIRYAMQLVLRPDGGCNSLDQGVLDGLPDTEEGLSGLWYGEWRTGGSDPADGHRIVAGEFAAGTTISAADHGAHIDNVQGANDMHRYLQTASA